MGENMLVENWVQLWMSQLKGHFNDMPDSSGSWNKPPLFSIFYFYKISQITWLLDTCANFNSTSQIVLAKKDSVHYSKHQIWIVPARI